MTSRTTGGALPDATIIVQDGPNAGVSTTTDTGGNYSLRLVGGTFSLTVATPGYVTRTQFIELTCDMQADFAVTPISLRLVP